MADGSLIKEVVELGKQFVESNPIPSVAIFLNVTVSAGGLLADAFASEDEIKANVASREQYEKECEEAKTGE